MRAESGIQSDAAQLISRIEYALQRVPQAKPALNAVQTGTICPPHNAAEMKRRTSEFPRQRKERKALCEASGDEFDRH